MKLYFTDDIVQFLSGNDRNPAEQHYSTSSTSEMMELSTRRPTQDDDDSMLVQLDRSPPTWQNPSPSSSDSDLAMYDDPNSTFDQEAPLMRTTGSQSRSAVSHNSCHCRCGLQGFFVSLVSCSNTEVSFCCPGSFCHHTWNIHSLGCANPAIY